MSQVARVLARLHASLLLHGHNVNLCADLAMLLSFFTLPDGLTRPAVQSNMPVLWCSEVAVAYACAVLLQSCEHMSIPTNAI